MSQIGRKTASNVYYLARIEAAKHNEGLSSREGAADLMQIDRGRLFRIESGVTNPYPEEILLMSNLYGAPELVRQYCSGTCPLGYDLPVFSAKADLNRITVDAMAAFRKISKAQDLLIDVASNKRIGKKDEDKLNQVIDILNEIGSVSESLKVWKKKNL